jgi:hypothetical protein
MDWIDISSMIIPPQIIKQIRAEEARRFKVIPVAFAETGLILGSTDYFRSDQLAGISSLVESNP